MLHDRGAIDGDDQRGEWLGGMASYQGVCILASVECQRRFEHLIRPWLGLGESMVFTRSTVSRGQSLLVRGFSMALFPIAAACAGNGFPQPFDTGVRYSHELHVDASARPGGDGSEESPFQAINEALAKARPGTRVRIEAGSYGAIGTVTNLHGTARAPIALVGNGKVVVATNGNGVALHLVDPRYVVIEGLVIRDTVPHGMNIDDGGSYASPASHVVLRNVSFSRIGNGGNNDCLKMSGVDNFYIENSRFTGCNQGEAIDMVGCHNGVIARNTFHDMPGSAVQTKGGSADVLVHGNRFTRIGQRAINAGGSTGTAYFRPVDARHEAERIQMVANVIEASGVTPVAFAGCDACVFANNTIVDPGDHVARIVEENQSRTPGANGFFINNIIVFEASGRRRYVDVGTGTRPATYTFGWNLWHALDDASFAGPVYSDGLPPETSAIVRKDPLLDAKWRPRVGSPAIAAGRIVPGGIGVDFERRGYGRPPTIGAFEQPQSGSSRSGSTE